VHEEGFQVERRADAELAFRDPLGSAIPLVPAAPDVPGDPVESIRRRNEAEGLVLDAHTAIPGWLGERLDLGYAMDVLHPLATSGSVAGRG
jgi:hypothetical protein